MEDVIKDEIEKLYNITIYNKEFNELKLKYNRKDTATRTKMVEHLNARLKENIFNFIIFSKLDIGHLVMSRSSDYESEYFGEINTNALNYSDFRFINNIELYNRRNTYFYDGHNYKMDNSNNTPDTFLLKSLTSSIKDFIYPEKNNEFNILSDIKTTDELKNTTEISLEKLLGLDVLIPMKSVKEWKKSIEREDLPDFKLIYEKSPEVIYVIYSYLYSDDPIPFSIFLSEFRSKVLFLLFASDLSYMKNDLREILQFSFLSEILVSLKNAISLIDKEKTSVPSLTKRNQVNFVDDDSYFFQLHELSQNLNSSLINWENKNSNNLKTEANKLFDGNFNRLIKDNKNIKNDKELIEDWDKKARNILLKPIDVIIKDLDNENPNYSDIFYYLIDDKYEKTIKEFDSFELLVLRRLNEYSYRLHQHPRLQKVEELLKDDFIKDILSVFEELKVSINLEQLDNNDLKKSSRRLLDDIFLENVKVSVKLSPTNKNLEQFIKVGFGNDFEYDINKINNNLENIKNVLIEDKDYHNKENFNFTVKMNKKFSVELYRKFSDTFLFSDINFVSDLSSMDKEDLFTLFLLTTNTLVLENKDEFYIRPNSKALFDGDLNINGVISYLVIVGEIMNSNITNELRNLYFKLLFLNLKLNISEYDSYYTEQQELITKRVLTYSKDNEIFVGTFLDYIIDNPDIFDKDIIRQAKRYRMKYVVNPNFL